MSENPPFTAHPWHRRILLFFRNFIMGLFLDPVAFISLLAPIIISIALGLIYGELLQQKNQGGHSSLDTLLTNPNLPGVADYVIQYYTALLAFVLGFAKPAFYGIFLPLIQKEKDPVGGSKNQNEPTPVIVFQIYSGMLFLFAFYAFCGLAPKLSLLEVYTHHTTKFGISANPIPPLESVLTWLRLMIGIFGLWRFQLATKQKQQA